MPKGLVPIIFEGTNVLETSLRFGGNRNYAYGAVHLFRDMRPALLWTVFEDEAEVLLRNDEGNPAFGYMKLEHYVATGTQIDMSSELVYEKGSHFDMLLRSHGI